MTAAIAIRIAPSHTTDVFDPSRFTKLVRDMVIAIRTIRKENPDIKMLAGCGNSGLPLLGALGLRLRMPILACRKEGDPAHDSNKVNGHFVKGSYLIVDDLISSGETVRGIYHNIQNAVINRHQKSYDCETWLPRCAGVLLYTAAYQKELGVAFSDYAYSPLNPRQAIGPHYKFTVPVYDLKRIVSPVP